MPKDFFERLKKYYSSIGKALRGEEESANIFPNTTDIGLSRERIYAEFLIHHLPKSSNVLFGGYLFNLEGNESKQIDIIITNSLSPRFNFLNKDGSGKSFACIDGATGVVAAKSNLSQPDLFDALKNIASLPDKQPIEGKVNPLVKIKNYAEFPYKIILSLNGPEEKTILKNIDNFYLENPDIPTNKRPNLIHVIGKYAILKIGEDAKITRGGQKLEVNSYHYMDDPTDVFALHSAASALQERESTSRHINYEYWEIINKIPF